MKRVKGPDGKEDYREELQGLDEVSASTFDRDFEQRAAASRSRVFSGSSAYGPPFRSDMQGERRAPSNLQIEDVTDQEEHIAAAGNSDTTRNSARSPCRQPVRWCNDLRFVGMLLYC